MCRVHNDANMLALGARVVGTELGRMIAQTYLTTEFEGGRHQRRIDQITAIENGEDLGYGLNRFLGMLLWRRPQTVDKKLFSPKGE